MAVIDEVASETAAAEQLPAGEQLPARVQEDALPVLRIQASQGWVPLQFGELWQYRELLYFLVWRNIKVRYKQTALGMAWAIIPPVASMLVFSVVFGRLAKMPSDNLPYPVFSYTGLLPWNLFANALTQSSNSLVGSATLLSKVYFPRLVIPMTAVISGMVDFVLGFVILLVLMVFYHITPTVNIVFLPLFVLLALTTALGVGLWLSALNVRYRDVQYVLGFLTSLWMWATPIVYPSSLVHGKMKLLYGLNPMAGVIEGFRWAMLGTHTAPGPMLIVSSLASIAILISGAYYFQRTERTFADIV